MKKNRNNKPQQSEAFVPKSEAPVPKRELNIVRFSGIAASRGIAIGPAFRYYRKLLRGTEALIKKEDVASELQRFEKAVEKARAEIAKIRRIAEQKVGTPGGSIFEAQMMMVSDEFILKSMRERISKELRSASFVVDAELSQHQKLISSADNMLMRERVDDIEDIKQRVLRHLMDREKWISRISEPSIMVGDYFTPADAILFSRHSVLGYAMDGGGITSHVSILARSLQVPAVVGLHNISQQIETGDLLILDGERGEIILHPDDETLAGYRREQEMLVRPGEIPLPVLEKDMPGARTSDGHPVRLEMNLEFGSEVAVSEAERLSANEGATDAKVLGLGLVRTEHFLLVRDDFATEQQQNELYQELASKFYPACVTLRTFDIGGDKLLSTSYPEANPFLGWRGLRISLDEPEMFQAQLRAILRASSRGNVKILLPMVTNVSEMRRANESINEAKENLRNAGEPFDERIQVGAMIEVPSAALLADSLAKHVDFFSIGSNDLTQYTLAVDRGNELIANLYQELHPAVLRLIRMTIDAGKRNGKPVTICGELGSYPLATPVLVGMDITEISVSPPHVSALASRIRLLNFEECQYLAQEILNYAAGPEDVKQHVLNFLMQRNLMGPFSESIVRSRK